MKNLDRQVFTGARGQASGMCYPLNLRAWLVCVLSIILSPFTLFAQAPVISYSSPQTYEAGTAISQLAPTSSGVAATGYGNPGTLATGLVNPQGVAVDAAGNVYVACYGDGTVKKVPAGGGAPVIIGTGFINPTAVAVDAAGNIYVADKGHNAVKEIPAAGGATITLASGINSPTGVAADAGGNVYVTNGADLDVIPVGSGVAQTYRSGFNMPSTVCIDAVGNVYVTCSFQSYYYTVQEIPVGGGTTVTLPDVMAEAPRGIAVDAAGNVYSSAGSVLKFPAGGGSGVTAVNSTNVYGVAVDAAGNLYVTGASGSVKKYKQVGGFYINAALPAGLSFDSKTGIISGTPAAASPATNYTITAYNSSGSSTAVVNIKVDLPPLPALSYSGPQTYTTGTAIAPLAPASSGVAALGYGSGNVLGSGFANPQGIAVDAAGNVYVACHDDGTVKKIPGGGGTPVVIGSGFNSPTSVAVDAAGNVCVADSGNNAVKKIPAGGGVPVSIGSGFNGPHSVAIDGAGNVYVADYSNVAYQYGRITEIPAGGAQITLVTDVQFSVTGVAVDAAGNVYYVTALYSQITEIPAGGNSTYIGDVGNASNLAVDPAGNVYAALSSHGGGVSKISAGGGASVVLVPRISPYGVAIDVTGNLYVTTTDGVIEKYNPVGGYYINAALPQGLTFNSNTGIISGTPTAAIPATNYTITAYNSRGSSSATVNIAVNFPPLPSLSYSSPHTYSEGTAIVPLAPTSSGVAAAGYGNGDILAAGLANPQGMAIDVAGNLYVACYNDGTVKKVPAGGGAPVVLGSGFNSPTGVAVDAAGNVYVADYGNKAVKKIPAAGGAPVTLASGITNLTGIAADAAGNVYVIGGNLYEIPVGKGVILVPYNFPNEYSVCIDAAGNIYVGYQDVYEDTHETIYVGAVAKIPAGGGTVITEEYGFTSPLGMTVDAAGNLYVATNNFIDKIPAGGGADFAVVSNVNTAGVAIDAVGNLYVATGGGNAIEKYKPVGGFYINAALPAGLNFDETTGIISGTPTAASPATNYTVTAYNSGGGASATLNIKVQSTDADLSALQISSGTLMPGFAPGIIAYTADVPNTVTSIAVTPTTSTQGATVNVNGTAVTSGTASPGIPLNVGPNTITTVVTVLDGTTTKTYTLTVTRAKSGDATLKGITMSTGSTPTFSVGGSYTASVSPGIASLTLTPTATDPNATITVNGVAVTSGTASQSIAINTNPTTINIQVTAADGVTKKSYTVAVSKNGSSDAEVDIALSTGSTLTRLSSAGTVNNYTASVTAGTNSLTVIPTASDPNATITVDGVAVASGTASQSIAINTNPTIITVQVTAQDGVTVRTNSISVYKNGSSNAGLSVALSTGSMLTYLSSTNNINYYSASVTAGTGSLTVTPTASDPNATITVNGIAVASGTASQSIAISANPTVITVQLTAQDGTTVRTRSINVYKDGSSNAGFVVSLSPGSALTYLSGTPQALYYSASVTAGTSSLTVTPTASDPSAAITVDGIAVTSGTASQSIALNTNPTIITVQETAQDGVTVRTHSISVYQAPSPPPALNSTDISVTKPADSPAIAEDGILVHPGLSPNGDGINDFLQIDNISQYPDNKLSIMNRNGQLIYEAKGYDNSSKVFDGHSNKNGQMQLPGTYFYQLDYTVNGVTKRKTGFLVLKY